jgi:hypothetical protein
MTTAQIWIVGGIGLWVACYSIVDTFWKIGVQNRLDKLERK